VAIEDTKFIEKIEAKAGGKTGTYWRVTWTDGKSDTLFNGEWKDLCEEAQENKLAVHYTKQKQGNYYNIISLELVRDALPPAKEPQEPEPHVEKPQGISGAEVGRCWNDINSLFINDKLDLLFGKENARGIAKQYRGYLLGTLKLNHDGAKLPMWETNK